MALAVKTGTDRQVTFAHLRDLLASILLLMAKFEDFSLNMTPKLNQRPDSGERIGRSSQYHLVAASMFLAL